jgi:hypothetical protein
MSAIDQIILVLLAIIVPTAVIELFEWRRRKRLERWLLAESERIRRETEKETLTNPWERP